MITAGRHILGELIKEPLMVKMSDSPVSRCKTRLARSPLLLAALVLIVGCEVPQFRGPQVQSPPGGFIKKSDVSQFGPRTFPERATVHFDAWIETEFGKFTGIYINGHDGSTTLEEVVAARTWSMENPPDHPMDYGDIETVEIDGRTAWAWMEIWRDNGLHEVRYHATVPYDTVTYTIDFTTGDPTYKARPDSIRAIVASFAIGRIEWNWPLLTISIILTALLLNSVWSKIKRRPYDNMRHMTLVQLPVEDSEAQDGADAQPEAGPSETDGVL
jgi:hypothetical protein